MVISLYASGAYQCCTHPHQVMNGIPMPSGRYHPRVCQFLKHPHQVMKVVTMPPGRYHPRVCPSQRSMLQNHTSHRPICPCLSHLVSYLPQLPPPTPRGFGKWKGGSVASFHRREGQRRHVDHHSRRLLSPIGLLIHGVVLPEPVHRLRRRFPGRCPRPQLSW